MWQRGKRCGQNTCNARCQLSKRLRGGQRLEENGPSRRPQAEAQSERLYVERVSELCRFFLSVRQDERCFFAPCVEGEGSGEYPPRTNHRVSRSGAVRCAGTHMRWYHSALRQTAPHEPCRGRLAGHPQRGPSNSCHRPAVTGSLNTCYCDHVVPLSIQQTSAHMEHSHGATEPPPISNVPSSFHRLGVNKGAAAAQPPLRTDFARICVNARSSNSCFE